VKEQHDSTPNLTPGMKSQEKVHNLSRLNDGIMWSTTLSKIVSIQSCALKRRQCGELALEII
jgi:hypothetical protein